MSKLIKFYVLKYVDKCMSIIPESSCKKEVTGIIAKQFVANEYIFFKKYIYLFIFGCVGSSLQHPGPSLVAVSRGYSLLWCMGFSPRWLLLLQTMGSRRAGFSSCGMQALERRLSSCGTRA